MLSKKNMIVLVAVCLIILICAACGNGVDAAQTQVTPNMTLADISAPTPESAKLDESAEEGSVPTEADEPVEEEPALTEADEPADVPGEPDSENGEAAADDFSERNSSESSVSISKNSNSSSVSSDTNLKGSIDSNSTTTNSDDASGGTTITSDVDSTRVTIDNDDGSNGTNVTSDDNSTSVTTNSDDASIGTTTSSGTTDEGDVIEVCYADPNGSDYYVGPPHYEGTNSEIDD